MSEPISAGLLESIRLRVEQDKVYPEPTPPEADREALLAEVDRLHADLSAARERIDDLERDRGRRPSWTAVRDLALQIRDERPKDSEVTDMVLTLLGGAS